MKTFFTLLLRLCRAYAATCRALTRPSEPEPQAAPRRAFVALQQPRERELFRVVEWSKYAEEPPATVRPRGTKPMLGARHRLATVAVAVAVASVTSLAAVAGWADQRSLRASVGSWSSIGSSEPGGAPAGPREFESARHPGFGLRGQSATRSETWARVTPRTESSPLPSQAADGVVAATRDPQASSPSGSTPTAPEAPNEAPSGERTVGEQSTTTEDAAATGDAAAPVGDPHAATAGEAPPTVTAPAAGPPAPLPAAPASPAPPQNEPTTPEAEPTTPEAEPTTPEAEPTTPEAEPTTPEEEPTPEATITLPVLTPPPAVVVPPPPVVTFPPPVVAPPPVSVPPPVVVPASPPPAALPASPAPSTSFAGTVGAIRNGIPTTITNLSSYSLILVSADDARAVASTHPRTFMYTDGPSVSPKFWSGVDSGTASSNGWILSGANGYGAYAGAIGSAGYRAEWARQTIARARAAGVYGVFIDDVTQSYSSLFGDVAGYSTWQQWADDMVGFVTVVSSALRAAGLSVMLNADGFVSGESGADDGTLTLAWWKRLAPHADLLMQEFWQQTPADYTMRVRGTNWDQYWDGWQRLPAWCRSAGVQFVGVTYGSDADAEYARASALTANPDALIIRGSPGTTDPWGRWAEEPGAVTVDPVNGTGRLR